MFGETWYIAYTTQSILSSKMYMYSLWYGFFTIAS